MAKAKTERKTRVAPPENETKAQKFSRITSRRLREAVKAIELIGNCAGPGYESTKDQHKKVFEHLDKAVADARKMFETGGTKAAKAGITI